VPLSPRAVFAGGTQVEFPQLFQSRMLVLHRKCGMPSEKARSATESAFSSVVMGSQLDAPKPQGCFNVRLEEDVFLHS
jgi:hypothetical protein